jgi:hypothetical protein
MFIRAKQPRLRSRPVGQSMGIILADGIPQQEQCMNKRSLAAIAISAPLVVETNLLDHSVFHTLTP